MRGRGVFRPWPGDPRFARMTAEGGTFPRPRHAPPASPLLPYPAPHPPLRTSFRGASLAPSGQFTFCASEKTLLSPQVCEQIECARRAASPSQKCLHFCEIFQFFPNSRRRSPSFFFSAQSTHQDAVKSSRLFPRKSCTHFVSLVRLSAAGSTSSFSIQRTS